MTTATSPGAGCFGAAVIVPRPAYGELHGQVTSAARVALACVSAEAVPETAPEGVHDFLASDGNRFSDWEKETCVAAARRTLWNLVGKPGDQPR